MINKEVVEQFIGSKYLLNLKLKAKNERIITVMGTVEKAYDTCFIFKTNRISGISYEQVLEITESNIILATNEQEIVSNLFKGNTKKKQGDE